MEPGDKRVVEYAGPLGVRAVGGPEAPLEVVVDAAIHPDRFRVANDAIRPHRLACPVVERPEHSLGDAGQGRIASVRGQWIIPGGSRGFSQGDRHKQAPCGGLTLESARSTRIGAGGRALATSRPVRGPTFLRIASVPGNLRS